MSDDPLTDTQTGIEQVLAAYLKGTGMESIDPAKFGAAMFLAGYSAGQVQAESVIGLMHSLSINPVIPEGIRTLMKAALDDNKETPT